MYSDKMRGRVPAVAVRSAHTIPVVGLPVLSTRWHRLSALAIRMHCRGLLDWCAHCTAAMQSGMWMHHIPAMVCHAFSLLLALTLLQPAVPAHPQSKQPDAAVFARLNKITMIRAMYKPVQGKASHCSVVPRLLDILFDSSSAAVQQPHLMVAPAVRPI